MQRGNYENILFQRGLELYDGEMKFLAIIYDNLHNFDGEAKYFSGETTKPRRGDYLRSKRSGETSFLGGSSFNLGGAMFQRGRYWGVFFSSGYLALSHQGKAKRQ